MIRRLAAALAAIALLLALAVPVMAGGWADIVADAPDRRTARRGQAARRRLPRPPARRDARAVGDRDGPFREYRDGQDHGRRRDQ